MKLFRFWLESLGVGILAACLLPLDFYQKNYPQLPGQDIIFIVGAFALIHALVWLILRFIFRNSDRTCLAAYTLWGAFWFSRPVLSFIRHSCAWTQALYDLIRPYRYAVVLGVFISVVLAAYLWLRKHPAVLRTTVKVLNIFMGVQLAILLGQIAHNVHEYAQLERHQQEHSVQPDGDYPNICHILLDAHPNLEGARLLGYDLQPFYDDLNKLGFITFPTSRSNYCMTHWSVPSMLTMDYLPGDETKLKDSTLYGLSQNNPVFDTLMQHGYHVQCATSHAIGISLYSSKYLQKSTYRLITTLVNIMFSPYAIMERICHIIDLRKAYRINHRTCLEWLLSPLDHQPMYRYAHILCPHAPFVFSDNASATYGLMVQDRTTNANAKLIPQIRANIAGIDAMVLPILKQLTQQPNPPIIILHSDHGTGMGIYPSKVDDSFGNLLALYIPDNWKSDAKDLKFINLYRFILNHLFNDHRPYSEQNRQIIRGKIFHPVNNNWDHIPK